MGFLTNKKLKTQTVKRLYEVVVIGKDGEEMARAVISAESRRDALAKAASAFPDGAKLKIV